MAIQAADIADIVSTTLKDLGRLRFTDLGTDKVNFVAFQQLMTKERVVIDSGYEIQWNVVVRNSGSARSVGLFAPDATNVADVMKTASIPWRHITGNYSFDEREPVMGGGAAKIVDLVSVRRNDALTAIPELMEQQAWTNPGSVSSDDPVGIPYWVCYPGSGTSGMSTGGFLGGDPSGYSAGAGGLASATYPRWQNYTGSYTSVTKQDLIRKWRRAARLTNFKAPTPGAPYGGAKDMGFYTNNTVIELLEEVLEAQNDNLGNDLASKDGMVVFQRRPVEYVYQLDANAGNPVYGIDWSQMNWVVMQGRFLKEKVVTAPNQHTVVNVHIDTTANLRCTDRRKQFVIGTGTTAF